MNNLDLILAVSGPSVPAATAGTMEIVVVGFAFVMIVLALLAMVTASIGAVFRRFDAKIDAKAKAAVAAAAAAAALAPKPVVSTPAAVSGEDEDPLLPVILAAAVHSVIGDRAHRIVSIRPGGPGWAQEGRRQIFSSHRVR